MRISPSGLLPADCFLRTAYCGLLNADCFLRVSPSVLLPAGWFLRIASGVWLPTHSILLIASCRLHHFKLYENRIVQIALCEFYWANYLVSNVLCKYVCIVSIDLYVQIQVDYRLPQSSQLPKLIKLSNFCPRHNIFLKFLSVVQVGEARVTAKRSIQYQRNATPN